MGLGGPEPCKPSEWCPPPPGHTVTDTVSAPGPQGANDLPQHRRCGSQCERAFQHSGNQKTNILFLRHAPQPAHTQDRTCETTSLSGWCKENSSLTKVQGPFQSTQGLWQGAKANVLRGCTRCRGAASTAAGSRGTEGGALEGMVGPGFCTAAWGGCSEGHIRAQGARTTEYQGPCSSVSLFQIVASRKEDFCWKTEQIVHQFNDCILQTGRLRSRPGTRPPQSHG